VVVVAKGCALLLFGSGSRARVVLDRSDPARPVLTVRGEIDGDSARRVGDAFIDALARGVREVVVDARGLPHLGAEGVSAFYRLVRATRERRPAVSVVVVAAPTRTRDDMRRLGLERVLDLRVDPA